MLVEDAGVLPDPADARLRGEAAFDEGTRVDVAAGLTVGLLMDAGLNLAKANEEIVVVIGWGEMVPFPPAAPSIAGDPASICWRRINRAWGLGVVINRTDDNGLRPGDRDLYGGPEQDSLLVAALQVVHLTGVASGNPCSKAFCCFGAGT